MFERDAVGTLDLLGAEGFAEFRELWSRYEAEPALLLVALVVAILLFARMMHSPLDRRSPQRGTYYLGNVRLGKNPKADEVARRRTRLGRDPDYDPDPDKDDPLV